MESKIMELKAKMDDPWSRACFELWSGQGAVDWARVEAGAWIGGWASAAQRALLKVFVAAFLAFGFAGLGGAGGWLGRGASRWAEGAARSAWASTQVGWWDFGLAILPAGVVVGWIATRMSASKARWLAARWRLGLAHVEPLEWLQGGGAMLAFAAGLACGGWDWGHGVVAFRVAGAAFVVLAALGAVAGYGFDVAENRVRALLEWQRERWVERCEELGAQEGFDAQMTTALRSGPARDGGPEEWLISGRCAMRGATIDGAFERWVAAATDRAVARLATREFRPEMARDSMSTRDHERLAWIAAPWAMAARVEKRALADAARVGTGHGRPLARRI